MAVRARAGARFVGIFAGGWRGRRRGRGAERKEGKGGNKPRVSEMDPGHAPLDGEFAPNCLPSVL